MYRSGKGFYKSKPCRSQGKLNRDDEPEDCYSSVEAENMQKPKLRFISQNSGVDNDGKYSKCTNAYPEQKVNQEVFYKHPNPVNSSEFMSNASYQKHSSHEYKSLNFNEEIQDNVECESKSLNYFNIKSTKKMPVNIISQNPADKISNLRNLKADYERALQTLKPSDVIKKDRQSIHMMSEKELENHHNRLDRILQQLESTDEKLKKILSEHLNILKFQQKTFDQNISAIQSQFIDIYGLSPADAINESEKIVCKAKTECNIFNKAFPIYAYKSEIMSEIKEHQVLIVSVDLCYSANVVIPLFAHTLCSNGIVVSCEVNSVLAINFSEKCSKLIESEQEGFVAYDVEQESTRTKLTRILFTTVNKLFLESLDNYKFSHYSCIIFHSFMNRTIETDILLESVRRCLTERPDFKLILLLSPFEDISLFKSYFSTTNSVSVFSTPNLTFPVSVVWKATSFSTDNYINEVASTALAIHVTNEPGDGDILVFLHTVEDMEEVFKLLMQKLQDYRYDNVECLPLYETDIHLSVLDHFSTSLPSVRKIILATSWAEMLVFPTVLYVIDSGVVKDFKYNAEKNTDLLNVTLVSRCRAKMRKSFAGRDGLGVCYRLYSKKNYLNDMNYNLPELYCKNPLEVMFKILHYKPDEATTLEFMQPLHKKAKENAVNTLHKYGALKDNHLTTLGNHIIKLPFPPKYSKLIVLGIQWGFAFETVVLVALFSCTCNIVKESSLFIHSDDRDEQKKINAMKLQFLQCDSEILSYLYIYEQWISNGRKISWCTDHCINITVIKKVYDKVQEICSIVKESLKQDVLNDLQINESSFNALQELLFDCFKEHLCVFTGHRKSGYWMISTKCVTFLHSSSVICQKEPLPQYVVFDHMRSVAFRDYMVSVISLPEKVVLASLNNGSLQINENQLVEKKLVQTIIQPVGPVILERVLGGIDGKKIQEMEEFLKKETKSDIIIIIDPSVQNSSVCIYTSSKYSVTATELLKSIFDKKRNEILHEVERQALELTKDQFKVNVYISWGKGASTLSADTSKNNESQISSTSESNLENKLDIDTPSIKCSINLMWLRRCCRGFAYVSFHPHDFSVARRLSMKTIEIKGEEAEIALDKNIENQLYISHLPQDVTDDDLKEAVEDVLPYNVKTASVKVVFDHPFITTERELHDIKEMLHLNISNLIDEEFNIEVKGPAKHDMNMSADVMIKNSGTIDHYVELFNSNLKMNGLNVKAEVFYHCNLIRNSGIAKALEKRFYDELVTLEKKLSNNVKYKHLTELFHFEENAYDVNNTSLKFWTHEEEIMHILFRTIHELLEGEQISSEDFPNLHKVFTHGGHLWLKTLEHINVYVIEEYKSKTLRLYGPSNSCCQARKRIAEFLEETANEIVRTVNLCNKNNRIFLKALIKKYGFNLNQFIELHKLRSAELVIRDSQLILHGTQDSIEEAEKELEELAESFYSEYSDEMLSSQETCSACSCPPFQLTVRLEYCGHLYCSDCIKGLIIAETKFPIKCCAEGCDKEILIEDIRKSLDYDEGEINRLLSRSLADYISKNVESLVYCPAADCSMFFDKTKVTDGKWNCLLCRNDICVSCNVVYHHGYTCEMYQGSKNNPNFSYEVWVKQQRADCRMCPKCKMAIERSAGCDHMTCSHCKIHFCWRCLAMFTTGQQVYAHLPYCTQNQARW